MGLLDTGDSGGLGIFGSGMADPRTQALLALAGGLMQGNAGAGFAGAGKAYQEAANSAIDRLAKQQQIGINNIQLQQAMQKWKWLQDAMNGADQPPQTQAVQNPAAPQIALDQGADQQPSLSLPDGSKLNTGGIGPTNANAQRMSAVAPVQVPAQSGNPFVQAANTLGITPRAAIMQSMMFPDAFNKAYGAALTPTDATRMALAAGQDPRAANAATLRHNTFLPLTNMRPGGGALDYNNLTPDGKPTLYTMPATPTAGTINIPTPGTASGFTNVPVTNALPNIAASAAAESGGKASGKAPFESITLKTPSGADVQLSPLEWATYQQTGQLPARVSGAAPAGNAGNGRYPGAPAAGGVGVGQTPGAAAAQTEAGKGSGQQLVADNQWANGFATRMFNLNKALTGLQNAGATGPGTDYTNTAASFLLAQTPFGLGKYLPGVDPSKISSYDEANKYLIQYAIGQAGSLGEGTDSKLATTLAGNANTHISNLAAQDVVRANMALERMKNAQVQSFNASGLPADKYQQWASKWNSNVNPSVFAWDTMTPDARAKAMNLMTPAQRQQFTTQYNWALQNRFIDGMQ